MPIMREVTTSLKTKARIIASSGGMIESHRGITSTLEVNVSVPVKTSTKVVCSTDVVKLLSPYSSTISFVEVPLIVAEQLEQFGGKLINTNSVSTFCMIMLSSPRITVSCEKELSAQNTNITESNRNLITCRKNIEMPPFLFGIIELL
jgi:hypothetical protein